MASSVLFMASVVNDGVAKAGDGGSARTGGVARGPSRQLPFGGTLFALPVRYMQLSWRRARRAPLMLAGVAFALTAAAIGTFDAVGGCLSLMGWNGATSS